MTAANSEFPAKGSVSISVIIPAHNEEEFLPKTLAALRKQTYENFEIIVVCNGCTDNTRDAACQECDQFFDITEKSLGKARNLGGHRARGDILLFLDADTLLEPQALAEVARRFTRKYSAGTLKGIPDNPTLPHRTVYWAKNFVHFMHFHRGSSGVILCWKDHFEAVGGFDEGLYLRENSDLMYKLRPYGRYKYIRAAGATTSMRRYEKKGLFEMARLWTKVWWMSHFSDLQNQTYELVDAPREPKPKYKPSAWLTSQEKRG
ncbi:MAG TPA: glycosyltransferase [Methylomirabilota bacterium]|nr:glycosyltransferase [Methylomirabilota bacterium]